MNSENKTTINWYPGHMAKALKEINEKIKMVDLVIVLLDARCPKSSFNPALEDTFTNKKCLYVLTKKDKADNKQTNLWLAYYQKKQIRTIAIDAHSHQDVKMVIKEATALMAEKRQKDYLRGIKPRAIKTMIVGIPNVGKSTLINALVGKKVTAVGDRPGITKVQQWIKINQDLELLDTPGILWPKFDDEITGLNLSISGAINDNVLPIYDIATYFVTFLQENYPGVLENRYHLTLEKKLSCDIITMIANYQGYLLHDKSADLERTSLFIIQEYRMGYYGKITLDRL